MPQQKCHLNWENFTRKSDISLVTSSQLMKFIKMRNVFSQIIRQKNFQRVERNEQCFPNEV